MSHMQQWDIHGPEDWVYTPAEIAHIARAAQQFQAALEAGLRTTSGGLVHLVRLHGLNVLDGNTVVTWPQPDESTLVKPVVIRADGTSAL